MRSIPWSTAEQYRIRAHREKQRAREVRALAFELVIGHVHPGNLGALPPAPRVLEAKAFSLGILTFKDVRSLAFE